MLINLIYKVPELKISYKPSFSFQDRPSIKSSSDAAKLIIKHFDNDTIAYYESAKIILLNNNNKVIGIYALSEGGLNYTIMDVRKILQAVLLTNSKSYIIVHNHPSSNKKPSKTDIDITLRIQKISKLMSVELLDHIIITPDKDYYSMADSGDLGDFGELDLM